ncbi:RusA family crossover junction endodeoxyribonuclease [Neisseria gonorrhoeae]|uniref:RusA family crossover junction endodeoxyribonuclease n=60 Tax=Neisseria gonorrhoeae TaxID=485 RepID=UPI00210D6168|nr:RusA family crossover junction endodeoxyribonuclease [Neisseria gonorrhoeae]
MAEEMRTCKACGGTKPLEKGFNAVPRKEGGVYYYKSCKTCRNKAVRQKRAEKTRGGGSRRDDGGKAARIHPRRARRLPDIGRRPVDATGRGMRVIRLILPYPVSANRYWRIWRNRAVRSAEAAAYRETVRRIAQGAGAMPSEGAVAVYVRLIPKANKDGGANKTVIDLDNALKVALDALQGVAYHNDRQVRRIAADYADEPVAGGGLAVEVGELDEK